MITWLIYFAAKKEIHVSNWHCFSALGRYFLFDVPSNSLFLVAEPVFRYLGGFPVTAGEQGNG
jgi:hypothetical protein